MTIPTPSCIRKARVDEADPFTKPAVRNRKQDVSAPKPPAGRILLASASPRRVDLLRRVIGTFGTLPCDVNEEVLPGEDPASYALRMAEAKARTACQRLSPSDETAWILGADTIVVLGSEILGKPGDWQEAKRMLESLRGRTHRVLTAICLLHRRSGKAWKDIVSTEVRMKPVTDSEIDAYLRSGEPFGKAGAYAIQGLGGRLVEETKGSFTNVVGLPVERLRHWMQALGILSSTGPEQDLPQSGLPNAASKPGRRQTKSACYDEENSGSGSS